MEQENSKNNLQNGHRETRMKGSAEKEGGMVERQGGEYGSREDLEITAERGEG